MAARHLKTIVPTLVLLAGTILAAGCGDEAPPTAPVNRAPAPQGSIPAQTVHVGETITLNLTAYFGDPDGDALSYSAESSAAAVVSASVSGSTLAIVGLATGTARVTVTATDPGGLAATQTFESTVPNRPPEALGSIPVPTVHVGDVTTLDLSPYFSDPDGDTLTYAAASSNVGVASVSMSGATLDVSGVATGTVRVTVTATDPGGLAATQTFEAVVPNRPPELQGSIPAQTVNAGETITLDLSSYLRDPDGDALTYSAAASDGGVVSVSLQGSMLALSGLAKGTARVTVVATDPGGLAATQRFDATVPNRPPEPLGSIPAQTVDVGETITLDLSQYFSDPDGDALAHLAAASDASVASVSTSGATLTISGLATGTAQVTATATDPAGLTATQTFSASVIAPGPDLVFTGVSPEFATLRPGASATFTFRIRNQGTASSEATTIRGMRSTNPIISPRDAVLSSHSFPQLAPQQFRTFQFTVSVDPRSAPGTIYIGMCLDSVPDESDTRNNCSDAARVTVTAQYAKR